MRNYGTKLISLPTSFKRLSDAPSKRRKGCVERWKQGKRVSQPEFTSWSMVYDKRSATFYRNKVSLSTVNGRVECEFELPADSPTPYEQYVLSDEYEFRASTLNTTGQPTSSTSTLRLGSTMTTNPRFRQIPGTKQSSVSTSVSTASQ